MMLRHLAAVVSVALLPLPAALAQSNACPAERFESDLRLSSRAPAAKPFYYEAEGDWIGGDAEEGFIVIELGAEGPIEFPLDAGFRFQAEKRTHLGTVEDPRIDELRRGDRVWVKFYSHDGRVVRLKLKRPRS